MLAMRLSVVRLAQRAYLRRASRQSFHLASKYFSTSWSWYCWLRRSNGIAGLPTQESCSPISCH
jgi:hypothetical protein